MSAGAPAALDRGSRLLVVRLSALGDVIHTIPAVVALRERADVTWVVEAPYRELVEIVAGVKTIPVRMKTWTRDPRAMFAAIGAMRRFDAAIDFQGLIKSAMLPWAARVKTRCGFDSEAIREKPALLFTTRKIAIDTSQHVIDQNLQLAAGAAGFAPGVGALKPAAPQWESFPIPVPGCERSIVLLPGAGKPNKIWPHFAGLARRIGPRALAVWGPGERALAEATGAPMAPATTLRELAAILRTAEVVIGGDTGPLHLAAALGARVIGLYGPTDPRRNGPYSPLSHVIDHFPATKSMESISVEEVVNMLDKVLAR